jgi:mRNA interferase RelE/StbE
MMPKSNSDSDIPQSDNIEFEIQLTPLALEMLENIKDKRHQKVLSSRIDKLKTDPEKQGKPLQQCEYQQCGVFHFAYQKRFEYAPD